MDLFFSSSSLLDYCLCFSIKELILLLFIFYQIGYYFGKRKIVMLKNCQNNKCAQQIKPLQYQPQSSTTISQQDNTEQVYQHSLKVIKEESKQPQKMSPQQESSQNQITNENTKNISKQQDELSKQFLSQKIKMEGKKIQSRGIFHMTFQKAQNPKFVRKIQKHQIITDYQVSEINSENNKIIPFGSQKFFQIRDQSSILQISTYENLSLHKFPIIQKKLIKTNQFIQFGQTSKANIPMSPSLCQNGKFNKFFKNQKKIGQGAFGVVYSVRNIFEGRQYAIKKLFIKNGLGEGKMETILNESIKQVSIISQYSHPNIIRFHTCWLQIANLNQALTFNTIYFKQHIQDEYSYMQQPAQLNFKKKKSNQQCIQISYISSQANSGFGFEGQSRKSILSSSKKLSMPKQQQLSCQVVSIVENQPKQKQRQKNLSDTNPVFALYIQMQLCPEGSLDRYLHKRNRINRNFTFLVIKQLLQGVHYLHSNGLVHRDLKPGNILINKKEKLIKIGDFGLSAQINQQIQYGKIGTPSYIAPQIIQKRPIRKQELHLIDVYSIGVIFYELLNMFNRTTKHEKLQKINNLKQSKIQLENEFKLEKKLIKMMTKTRNRLSIKQIFERQQYIELNRLVQNDKQILLSWEHISGLKDNESQNQ